MSIFHQLFLHATCRVARSSSGSVAICFVLPVFFDDVICTRNGQECKRRDKGVYLIIVTQPYLAARRILN